MTGYPMGDPEAGCRTPGWILLACAWCERIKFNGVFVKVDRELYAQLLGDERLSHGSCVPCMDAMIDRRLPTIDEEHELALRLAAVLDDTVGPGPYESITARAAYFLGGR